MSKISDIIGAVAPAAPVISGIGSVIGGIADRNAQKKINKQNIAMQRETNALQYRMFNEANQFNERMSDKQWNRETEYNDPSAQLARYMAAGINPYNDNASAVSAGSANVSPPSSAVLPSISSPRAEIIGGTFERSIAGFSQIATAMGALAQAKKAGADTLRIESLLNEEVRDMKLKNEMQDILNGIEYRYGMEERGYKTEKAHQDVLDIMARITLSQDQHDINETQKLIKEIERKMADENYKWLPKQLKVQLNNLVKQGNAIDAQAEASRASAENSRASASYTREQERRLNQPFAGLNLSDEQKTQLADIMFDASLHDNQARDILSKIKMQEGKWSTSSMNELLRWMQNAVNDFPVIGPILKALQKM